MYFRATKFCILICVAGTKASVLIRDIICMHNFILVIIPLMPYFSCRLVDKGG